MKSLEIFSGKTFLFTLFASLLLAGCGTKSNNLLPEKEIDVIFTGDIHCNIDGELGYPNAAAFKKELLESTPNVTLVDLGDAIQGELIGTVSKGLYITQLMNAAGYDYAVIGNHEFDFGLKNFERILNFSNAKYLNSNIRYTGKDTDYLDSTLPYDIVSYGKTKVAYLGISSPLSIKKSTPSFFQENGKYVYDFCENKSGSRLFGQIQHTVDKARRDGADYVIVLSHLGILENNEIEKLFNAVSLINHTKGINAVIDAHELTSDTLRFERNINGQEIPLAGTGTKFDSIGKLSIGTDGKISLEMIHSYGKKDSLVQNEQDLLQTRLTKELGKTAARTNIALSITNSSGIRTVRIRENVVGNLCADALRSVTGADICIVNGGGVRTGLPEGDITNADIINVNPFNNKVCMTRVSGQAILDCLEFGAKNVTLEIEKKGKASGEFGGFIQVSGLKYTIDTNLKSPVVTDDKGFLADIRGYRRVKDVYVLKNGQWTALEPEKEYTVGGQDYILKNSGDGNTSMLSGQIEKDSVMIDNQALLYYITDVLGGDLGSRYRSTEGRITVM